MRMNMVEFQNKWEQLDLDLKDLIGKTVESIDEDNDVKFIVFTDKTAVGIEIIGEGYIVIYKRLHE